MSPESLSSVTMSTNRLQERHVAVRNRLVQDIRYTVNLASTIWKKKINKYLIPLVQKSKQYHKLQLPPSISRSTKFLAVAYRSMYRRRHTALSAFGCDHRGKCFGWPAQLVNCTICHSFTPQGIIIFPLFTVHIRPCCAK